MNIVIITNRVYDLDGDKATVGGIQTYLINLCDVINKSFSVKPVIFQYGNGDFYIDKGEHFVQGVNIKKFSSEKHRIKVLVDKFKSVYSHKDTLIIWGSDQYSVPLKNYRSINIQHGIAFDTEATDTLIKRMVVNSFMCPFYKFLQRFRARKLVKNGNKVVCVDYNFKNWIRTYLVSEVEKERFVVIPNFADTSNHIADNIATSHNIKMVIARRFVKRRGIELSIEVCKVLLDKFSNLSVTFAGDGPEKNKIVRLQKLFPDRVYITSYKSEDSLHFHKSFQISLIPSIGSEGTSLSLLEAMSSGCICVATDVGGMTNIILDEYNGFLVSPTANSISNRLSDIISNYEKYDYISYNGIQSVKHAFSKDIWEKKWIEILRSMLP
ncbi:TPA: glycosyltransferase family 4 protein [Vibrio cholerae]|uniref:glycosyltransferase family 4 protein n=1 Tax=Vibrio cholerae TaxID=666 RepID=UPI001F1D522B|nr:glycosyltransferase family 4 protein [Vibrio cholerae]UIP03942.1 glycosyltransferase family 4 protein [Vibrio cholerae]HEQ3434731.1 glycosyltransferase family 4 protein [Vibrio cholerae]HEQ3495610.1 glycosyltransferase family 4 protein [Vibrio cholerae]HEQ3507365.1 glycosyltransferase family 4 protein [Vibrio cholerae]HEQ3571202.1 glycosyltransferase family 4 protein [Vibrio cholerae]